MIQPKVSNEDVKSFMTDVLDLVGEIRCLRDNITEKEGDTVKSGLLSALGCLTKPLKDIVISFEDVSQKTERLSLLAASLPPDDAKRDLQLRAVKFMDLMFGLVHVLHGKADSPAEDLSPDLIKELHVKQQALEPFKLEDACRDVVKALEISSSATEMPFTPDALAKSCFDLENSAIAVQSSWSAKKA